MIEVLPVADAFQDFQPDYQESTAQRIPSIDPATLLQYSIGCANAYGQF
jgi:hypothetical protein